MSEQIKELIEKIQQEGVKAAEDKARAIIDEAGLQAQAIIKEAQKEAQSIILGAQDRAAKMEESGRASLKQAGRDMLLSLRAEINEMLGRMVRERVREALGVEELSQILGRIIKEAGVHEKAEVVVTMKKEDAEKLEKGFLAELKSQVHRGIKIASSDAMHGGFTISYDSGRSLFDFTDKALEEYIVALLSPKLAEVLRGK
ncbi:MAG TPA: hypothetical protein DCL35_01270 [Candidatus Omnitrophica bacterium]|nr:hypothetical protein [Candidatus Omnitrophota bacterium]